MLTQGICWHQCIPEKPWRICKPFGSDKRSSPGVSGLHTYSEVARVSIIRSYLRDSNKSQLPKKFPQKELVWVRLPYFLTFYTSQYKWKSIWTTHWGSRQHCLQLESTSETPVTTPGHPSPGKPCCSSHSQVIGDLGRGADENSEERRGCGEIRTRIHCWYACKRGQLLWKTVRQCLNMLKTVHMPQQSHC